MQFYVLNGPKVAGYPLPDMIVLEAEDFQTGPAPRCVSCGKYIGTREWLPPFRAELDVWRGREFGDVARVGQELVVSLRFKLAWEHSRLMGLDEFEPVEVVSVKSHSKRLGSPPPYFRATVLRSKTAIDLAASEFEWDGPPTCPTCLLGQIVKRWKRITIDQSTWNGEDVFHARGSSIVIIVSERFHEFCEREQIRNAVLVPSELHEHDYYPWEKDAVG
jgi:hypothetical protein